MRMVMAQQVSTIMACRLAEKVKLEHPYLTGMSIQKTPSLESLRAAGLSTRRAQCCIEIAQRSEEILATVGKGEGWESALSGLKGIGPWTIAVFRIMVVREPDVLPTGDVGLERAVSQAYGQYIQVGDVSEKWRPYRSVACWYLWRTLGNLQLG